MPMHIGVYPETPKHEPTPSIGAVATTPLGMRSTSETSTFT